MVFKKFAITGHARRAFPQNEAISKTLADIGIIVPEFKTFRVNFNGQNSARCMLRNNFLQAFMKKKIKIVSDCKILRIRKMEKFLQL